MFDGGSMAARAEQRDAPASSGKRQSRWGGLAGRKGAAPVPSEKSGGVRKPWFGGSTKAADDEDEDDLEAEALAMAPRAAQGRRDSLADASESLFNERKKEQERQRLD